MIYLIKELQDDFSYKVAGYTTSEFKANLINYHTEKIELVDRTIPRYICEVVRTFSVNRVLPKVTKREPIYDTKNVYLNIGDILQAIEDNLGIKAKDMIGPRRTWNIVQPRAIIGALLHSEGCTLCQTSAYLGRTDHTTTKNWLKIVDRELTYNPEFQEMYTVIESIFNKVKVVTNYGE